MNEKQNLKEEKHHKQQEFCYTRPAYRASRRLTAVKVYTAAAESQHLFIYNVPKINLRAELKNLCSKYGQILLINVVPDYKTELFTECYHVQFDRIQAAKIAKRLIDNKSFYGQVLHVCYAPEYENIAETQAKLDQRRRDVLKRIENPNRLPFDQRTLGDDVNFMTISKSQLQKKRKYEDLGNGNASSDNNTEEFLKDFYSIYDNKSKKNKT
ncbi:RNA-binding protein 48 [Agrilus planipennis]|uniref:RNA-binding protein 48 n=1 Tax=Agrilus planipennis TaxID=224129 RepID=A0A1W4WPA1_AGRPL|nr:RNA-binding protein 48 [Agrilus planipennis]